MYAAYNSSWFTILKDIDKRPKRNIIEFRLA